MFKRHRRHNNYVIFKEKYLVNKFFLSLCSLGLGFRVRVQVRSGSGFKFGFTVVDLLRYVCVYVCVRHEEHLAAVGVRAVEAPH